MLSVERSTDMQDPNAGSRLYRVRADGRNVVLSDPHGAELWFAPADAVLVSNALLQAAVTAEGQKAWQRR